MSVWYQCTGTLVHQFIDILICYVHTKGNNWKKYRHTNTGMNSKLTSTSVSEAKYDHTAREKTLYF